jgi:hypothetical protein
MFESYSSNNLENTECAVEESNKPTDIYLHRNMRYNVPKLIDLLP